MSNRDCHCCGLAEQLNQLERLRHQVRMAEARQKASKTNFLQHVRKSKKGPAPSGGASEAAN